MLTKIMRCSSISMLLLALFWSFPAGYHLALQFVVCIGALLVAWEAYCFEKHLWAVGFCAIALVFNPFQSMTFSREMFLWMDLLSMATFLASLTVLKAKPKFSMPLITSEAP
ncbi:MAG: hypothetical protein HY649_03825 [Acidobacteria bacterium]|nr:hypothetical protein [Acidobacteriota bacterium]